MSNTFRNTKNAKYLRNFRHISYKRNEMAANDEFISENIVGLKNNRVKSKINNIPDPWDDFVVSGHHEVRKHSKWKTKKVWLR